MEHKRPKNWTPDKEIQKKVEQLLKDPMRQRSKAAIEKYRKEEKEGSTDRKSTKQDSDVEEPSAFTATLLTYSDVEEPSAFTTSLSVYSTSELTLESDSQFALANSFILDSGATTHVCNDRTRFKYIRPAHDDDRLIAGKDVIPIEGFGPVEITVEGPHAERTIILENTVLVPQFHTNVVSLRKFIQRNVHWDTENSRLKFNGNTFCKTPVRHGQWVLEYNPLPQAQAFAAQKSTLPMTKKGSREEWHDRLGHLNPEAIAHLPNVVDGVIITPSQSDPACEVCWVCYSKRKISRRPIPQATTPFYRIHFDLI